MLLREYFGWPVKQHICKSVDTLFALFGNARKCCCGNCAKSKNDTDAMDFSVQRFRNENGSIPAQMHFVCDDGKPLYFQNRMEKLGGDDVVSMLLERMDGKKLSMKVVKSVVPKDRITGIVEHEASLLKVLEHPNILKSHGTIRGMSTFGVVTEYAKGGTLEEHLLRPICDAEKLEIAIDVAEGMEYLHKNDILCEHLKCDSVYLLQDFYCVIGDLSHALPINSPTSQRKFSKTRVVVDKNQAFKEDVYQYGVLLAAIVTQVPTHNFTSKDGNTVDFEYFQRLTGLTKIEENLLFIARACCRTNASARPQFDEILELFFPGRRARESKRKFWKKTLIVGGCLGVLSYLSWLSFDHITKQSTYMNPRSLLNFYSLLIV